jgi:FkbM family methyltransferase
MILPYLLILYLYVYVAFLQKSHLKSEVLQELQMFQSSHTPFGGGIHQQLQNFPRGSSSKNTNNQDKQRIDLLEKKLHSYLAWGSDPFFSSKTPSSCKKISQLVEYCTNIPGKTKPEDCHTDMKICLDDFPYKNCTIYDFGIRKEPDFGVILSLPPFDCQVYAFDPSPITQKWFAGPDAKFLKQHGNYHLYLYGGGFDDETISLNEYNWDQVSIYVYPDMVVNPEECNKSGHCRYHKYPAQKVHKLPVRSVQSIMKELGHTHLDILKLDVEGSEYRMLESLIEEGGSVCQNIDQVALEWHHYDFDLRYGASSLPHLNVLYTMLQEVCGLSQFWIHSGNGWPSNEKIYADMQIILRYNVASFKRQRK